MTQEDKQLLLKDLCMRIPYHTLVQLNPGAYNKPETCLLCGIDGEKVYLNVDSDPFRIDHIKPYLRPMSSMTEKEKMEVTKLGVCDDGAFHNDIYDIGISMEEAFTAISWFLERCFDINYLIEKGLAIEAPEGMYKN